MRSHFDIASIPPALLILFVPSGPSVIAPDRSLSRPLRYFTFQRFRSDFWEGGGYLERNERPSVFVDPGEGRKEKRGKEGLVVVREGRG